VLPRTALSKPNGLVVRHPLDHFGSHIFPLFLLRDPNVLAWVRTIAGAAVLARFSTQQTPHAVEIGLALPAVVNVAQVIRQGAVRFTTTQNYVAVLTVMAMRHRAIGPARVALPQGLANPRCYHSLPQHRNFQVEFGDFFGFHATRGIHKTCHFATARICSLCMKFPACQICQFVNRFCHFCQTGEIALFVASERHSIG